MGGATRQWNTITFIVSLLIRLSGKRAKRLTILASSLESRTRDDPLRRQCQVGSLTGAVHLSNGNAGVLRQAQRGQKPRVEQKGKSSLDFDFQYEYRPRKRGLSILLILRISNKRCQKSYHRDNWLVAAKRPQRRCFLILRCRLFLSLWSRIHKALDCSPTNRERELGLDRRETG